MDTECLLRDERGLTSAVGLCALMVLILLALAAAQFMRGGSSVSAEYEREMQLRLAAESGIETAAAGLERAVDAYGPPPREGRMPIAVGEVPAAENTALSVYIEVPPPGEADGCIYLVAAAIDEGEARMPDGENWKRAKIVRALMEKKGDRYVWRRWF